MEARLQRRIQRYGWDKAVQHYAEGWTAQLAPVTDRVLARAELRPGERVLDVACGTGALAIEAARRVGPQGFVVGVDISENMVAASRRAAEAAGLAQCRFERREAEDLAGVGDGFDAALCRLGLMYVTDAEEAVAGMAARLAPRGRLVASVWGRRDRCGWAALFPIIDARVTSEVCPLFFRLGTGDALRDALSSAGLRDVEVERFQVALRFEGDEQACDAGLLGGPVALAYSRFDDPTRQAVRSEYLRSIERFRAGDAYAIPGELVVARGTR